MRSHVYQLNYGVSMKNKRLGIYATYDRNGIIDEYVIYFLKEMKTVVGHLVVVSNQVLTETMQQKIDFVDEVFIRDDSGFDAGAISDVFCNKLGWEHVSRYEEVVIVNDSVFGPFYSLESIFDDMAQRKELDFWGLAKRGISDFDGGDTLYPEHIQLYLYVVRNRMLHSEVFRRFWEEIPSMLTSFRSAIINYEFSFTQYFEKAGFLWDIYTPTPGFDTPNPKLNLSPYHYHCFNMIKDGQFPVLKRKLFIGDFVEMKYADRSDLRKAFRYVKEMLNYDTDMIWSHILRVYLLHEIIESMQLYRVIPYHEGKIHFPLQCRIVEINSKMFAEVKERTGQEKYVLVTNLYRDEEQEESLRTAKKNVVIDNLACSEEYICNVMKEFEKNPRLGIVIPPISTFGLITDSFMGKWGDEDVARSLYNELRLQVPIDFTHSPIHRVEAFWCRADIWEERFLEKIQNDSTGTMMQMMALVAQEKGYYTEILQSDCYVATQTANMGRIIKELLRTSKIERNLDINETLDECKSNELQNYCHRSEKIYIYGAGQLACRVARMIGDFEGFLVTFTEDNPSELYGHCVWGIDYIDIQEECTGIIIATGHRHSKHVIKILEKKNITEYFVFE